MGGIGELSMQAEERVAATIPPGSGTEMETSRKSSTARLLAVAALAVTAVALIVIVSTSLGGSGSSSGSGSTTASKAAPKVLNGTKLGNFWTVRPNQTLSTIGEKTGVSVEELQTLNPNVDPQTLHEGERIRIKPKP